MSGPSVRSSVDRNPGELTAEIGAKQAVNRRNVERYDTSPVLICRHPDHWDEAAREELDADVPPFCQPEEADAFTEEGFTDVRPVDDEITFDGGTIHRTPGQHGHGELAEGTGPVSGFVFEGDETVSVAGDTIWYEPVDETLNRFEPDVVGDLSRKERLPQSSVSMNGHHRLD